MATMKQVPNDSSAIIPQKLQRLGFASSSCGTVHGSSAAVDMVMNMVTKRRGSQPQQISAAEFKATCLDLMDEVDRTGAPIIVTKRGRPVAQLAPVARAYVPASAS